MRWVVRRSFATNLVERTTSSVRSKIFRVTVNIKATSSLRSGIEVVFA